MVRRRRRRSLSSGRRRRRARSKPLQLNISDRVSREIIGILLLGLSILSFLSLNNNAGSFGVFWQETVLTALFGLGAIIAPIFFLVISLSLLLSKKIQFAFGRILGLLLLTVSSLALIQLSAPAETLFESSKVYGGYIGFTADFFLFMIFGQTGATVIVVGLAVISLLLIFNISFRELLDFFQGSEKPTAKAVALPETDNASFRKGLVEFKEKILNTQNKDFSLNIIRGDQDSPQGPVAGKSILEKLQSKAVKKDKNDLADPEGLFFGDKSGADFSSYQLPSLDFLAVDDKSKSFNDDQLVTNAEIIRRKLDQFNIPVTMKDAHVGPTVVQYTLKPAEDVKLSKITTLKNDLALALSAQAIRIEAPIPGKGLVGIEVPVQERSVVRLGSLLRSPLFQNQPGDLKIILGRDVSGHPVFDDMAKMPHLLVAGQTGSGKSIGINSAVMSLLYQHTPETLRFVMIDPKRVELTTYNGIPHLLTPVITEPDKALQALKWCVSEMNRRYKELARKSKRNIDEYNLAHPENKMPFIVVIIDELADLMMAASKEIEATICRIAQMARATGLHLLIATQRPSVDVITGLIKANIPTRIAYTVATGIDSRTIIDTIGAEDLIGQGDMLFLASHMSKPQRVQGAYLSTGEIEKIIHNIKLSSPVGVQYDDSITADHSDVPVPGLSSFKVGEGDELGGNDLDRAIQAIKEGKKASASYLQRRCSFGYAKAARILDQLEEMGLIGPVNGAKARAIYITEETNTKPPAAVVMETPSLQ